MKKILKIIYEKITFSLFSLVHLFRKKLYNIILTVLVDFFLYRIITIKVFSIGGGQRDRGRETPCCSGSYWGCTTRSPTSNIGLPRQFVPWGQQGRTSFY